MSRIDRAAYAALYGPTVGDRVRLGDTDLIIQVEADRTHYGEELTFGGGQSIRDGMGQGQRQSEEVADLVLTNVLILDHWGIVKADVGIRRGRILGIGKAGNPDTQAGVEIPIGPGTEIIAGEGQILTAGGIDALVHFVHPQQVEEALLSGLTTLLGGGTGANATACTPGPWNIRRMLQAAEDLPVNIGLFGKGNGSQPNPLEEQVRAGAMGLNLHEDWGTTPAAIDCALGIAEKMDIQVSIHPDTLNESGVVEDTIAACKDRCVHVYRTQDGGQAPDLLKVAGLPHVLPSSSGLAHPYTVNSSLSPSVPADAASAAGDILHDLGALSMIVSAAPALGRLDALITRTWRIAHRMKVQRGALAGDPSTHDNARVKRYLAKYTINPAIAHGIAHEVGSVEVGKLADLVLWQPAFFAVRPSLVLKGGMIAAAPLWEPAAMIPTPPMFGVRGRALGATCMTFLSRWANEAGEPQRLGLERLIGVTRDSRIARKAHMLHNDCQPVIEIDPQTAQVRADGEPLICEPARELPLARRYCLF